MFQFSHRLAILTISLAPFVIAATAHAQVQTVVNGTMCVCDDSDSSIYDYELKRMISDLIPDCSKKLLMFTQCYGGDFLDDFAGDANTAATSANSPGKQSYYDGYDDDAAAGLRPAVGRTASDVHGDGVAGRDSLETPQTGGALPGPSFPMDPVGTNDVHSRHVLFYTGQPDPKDDAMLDTIKGTSPASPTPP